MRKDKKIRILYKLYKQLHNLYMDHNNPYNPYYGYDYLKGTMPVSVDYRCTDEGYKKYLAKSEQIRFRLERVINKIDFIIGGNFYPTAHLKENEL